MTDKAAPYKLVLNHAENPDIPGYWQTPADPKKKTIKVNSLQEARTKFRAWIDHNGLGSGNLTKQTGRLTDKSGKFIGRLSYNGRLWDEQGNEIILPEPAKV